MKRLFPTALLLAILGNGCSSDPPAPASSKPPTKTEWANAIVSGDKGKVLDMVKAGADVNATVSRDGTALHVAVTLDQAEIVEILLDAKADIDAATELGLTPLLVAVFFNQADIAQLLIKRGADVDACNSAGTSALIMAATNKLEPVGLALIDAGCDVNHATKGHGTTALMMAAHNDLAELAKALIARGANPQIKDQHGKSALDYAKTGEMKTILSPAKKS